ncbi:M28 family peptidase [Enterococcus sp. AZ109]|uniref:M28 family peptidase n=1 Tax=Enterococcus sp. AZ109 TaxID=2774634 RepID=UPI003F206C3B
MYQQIKELPLAEQIETVAKELVKIPSINSSKHGERDICLKIQEILRSFPYFNQHPELVWTTELMDDPYARENVFAFLPKEGTKEIILLHAHMDTVGIEDFGKIKSLAYDPDKLCHFFQTFQEDEILRSEACSGEWAFGRGMLDMKSGIAVHLMNLLFYSQQGDQLPFNLLFMGNPVEENDHTGIIDALPQLVQFQEKGYEFIAAINTDFVSPLSEEDQTRYLYTGAAGKMLSCFYIKGREAHVGNTLQGVDPTLISSAINLAINTNIDLCEEIEEEEILPSSVLYQRDCKDFYNVQTAQAAQLYFNTFLYERSAKEVLASLLEVTQTAVDQVSEMLDRRLLAYQQKIGTAPEKIDHSITVYLFEDYLTACRNAGVAVDTILQGLLSAENKRDKREVGFALIDALENSWGDDQPKVVLFLAPPFCPHNEIESHSKLHQAIQQAAKKVGEETGEVFQQRRFFPFLSDSSYLAMRETDQEIDSMMKNFPGMETIYPLPVQAMQQLAIPAVNLGVFGKGAHTWKERIYKPYSYSVLPYLIREVIASL